jgi:heme exporter protein A
MLFAPLSFALHAGEAMLLSGSNGAGKSTLLRVLAGLAQPASGNFTCDQPFLHMGHKNALHPALTVEEQISFWHGLARNVAQPLLLEKFGLTGLGHRRCAELSEGQKRRLSLTRLAIYNAKLWLLDEPHAALDNDGMDLLRSLITEHIRNNGAALITSHGGLELNNAKNLKLEAAQNE